MVPATTQQVFAVFRDAAEGAQRERTRSLTREQLLEQTGFDAAALDAEIDFLQKMVLIIRPDPSVAAWQLTPLGIAACQNSKTWETIFRR